MSKATDRPAHGPLKYAERTIRRNVRVPESIDEMVVGFALANGLNLSEALVWILREWAVKQK